MLTPIAAAILITFDVVTRWVRSVNAVLDDWARAFCTVVPPPCFELPMISPPSFSTGK
jgi:hypothetical protein